MLAQAARAHRGVRPGPQSDLLRDAPPRIRDRLLTPNVVTIAGLFLAFGSLELQVRRIEEPYLLTKHGGAYRDYTARVGRFLPGVGLIR